MPTHDRYLFSLKYKLSVMVHIIHKYKFINFHMVITPTSDFALVSIKLLNSPPFTLGLSILIFSVAVYGCSRIGILYWITVAILFCYQQ